MKCIVAKDMKQASRTIADMFKTTVLEKPGALLGLATGGTVTEIYRCMCADYADGKVDFSKARTVNLDEYIGLPHSHEQSFAYFMDVHLFSKTNFVRENIHLYDGSKDPNYEVDKMSKFLDANTIDILMLGIGNNGHIGFNEPDSRFIDIPHCADLAEETIEANSRFFDNRDEVPRSAFTIGMRDIVKAKKVVLAAFGAQKAGAVKKLFADNYIDPMLPCSILKLIPEAYVIVDKPLADAAGIQ
jgi:6-phosphogluconolactonase/Glucosamine-6-phosphate isomerase/deaminase